MIDITAVGEILIDLTQTGVSDNGIPVYTAFPGGAPADVAVAAAKLGAQTSFKGKRRQLSAPDVAPEKPQGSLRRRLCRRGLSQGTARAGRHEGS